jgi:hypothetical protein
LHGASGRFELLDRVVEGDTDRFESGGERVCDARDEIAIRERRQSRGDFIRCPNALGIVGREFYHFDDPTVLVEDRNIRRLDPDDPAAFTDSLEFLRDEFTAGQPSPESSAFVSSNIICVAEHLVVPTPDFLKPVAHDGQGIFVGRDVAGRCKFDDRLGTRDSFGLCLCVGSAKSGPGDHACKLDNLIGPAAGKERIVGCLDPDFAVAFADALVFAGVEFPTAEICPELAISSEAT